MPGNEVRSQRKQPQTKRQSKNFLVSGVVRQTLGIRKRGVQLRSRCCDYWGWHADVRNAHETLEAGTLFARFAERASKIGLVLARVCLLVESHNLGKVGLRDVEPPAHLGVVPVHGHPVVPAGVGRAGGIVVRQIGHILWKYVVDVAGFRSALEAECLELHGPAERVVSVGTARILTIPCKTNRLAGLQLAHTAAMNLLNVRLLSQLAQNFVGHLELLLLSGILFLDLVGNLLCKCVHCALRFSWCCVVCFVLSWPG